MCDQDYVLGTHDAEIERLGVQHYVWRPRVLDAWRRAEFSVGQTILDVGCGPGYASLDLAEIVGPEGHVLAIDRSRRFLDNLQTEIGRRQIPQVSIHETDLDAARFPLVTADGAWCRWVLSFLTRPRQLLEQLAAVLKPGARFVSFEYINYETWQLYPRSPEFDEFVHLVTKAWRETGGEPNLALEITRWLPECGFRVQEMRPIVDVVSPSDYVWQWPKTFVETGTQRLVDLGYVTPEHARAVADAMSAREKDPLGLMVTPMVLELIAVRV